jgi:hypothetical protein
MALNHPPVDKSVIPSTVVIGVPNQKALHRVIKKLTKQNIKFEQFHEPDWDYGLTAIATVPMCWSEAQPLHDYSIWREKNNVENVHTN